ncbi:MAG TPA: thiamine phosphate synthase [Sphingomicrobium sp.]|nr:thiamine phosphate synthase [Sphingomicrobium sp.]
MHRRQRVPREWLIIADEGAIAAARRLKRGTGLLLLGSLPPAKARQLRAIAQLRGLAIVREGRNRAVRVHDLRELRAALRDRTSMCLLSPLHPTRSHPDWSPIPRMRAAALARLCGRRLFALGGMDARKFARIKALGFQGWAGISAFRT